MSSVQYDGATYTVDKTLLATASPFFALNHISAAPDIVDRVKEHLQVLDNVQVSRPILVAWCSLVLTHHKVSNPDKQLESYIPHPQNHRCLVHVLGHLLSDKETAALLRQYIVSPKGKYFPVTSLQTLKALHYTNGAVIRTVFSRAMQSTTKVTGTLFHKELEKVRNELVPSSVIEQKEEEKDASSSVPSSVIEQKEEKEDDGVAGLLQSAAPAPPSPVPSSPAEPAPTPQTAVRKRAKISAESAQKALQSWLLKFNKYKIAKVVKAAVYQPETTDDDEVAMSIDEDEENKGESDDELSPRSCKAATIQQIEQLASSIGVGITLRPLSESFASLNVSQSSTPSPSPSINVNELSDKQVESLERRLAERKRKRNGDDALHDLSTEAAAAEESNEAVQAAAAETAEESNEAVQAAAAAETAIREESNKAVQELGPFINNPRALDNTEVDKLLQQFAMATNVRLFVSASYEALETIGLHTALEFADASIYVSCVNLRTIDTSGLWHWVAIFIRRFVDGHWRVRLIDPRPSQSKKDIIVGKVRDFLEPLGEISVEYTNLDLQYDTTSCGIWCVAICKYVISSDDINVAPIGHNEVGTLDDLTRRYSAFLYPPDIARTQRRQRREQRREQQQESTEKKKTSPGKGDEPEGEEEMIDQLSSFNVDEPEDDEPEDEEWMEKIESIKDNEPFADLRRSFKLLIQPAPEDRSDLLYALFQAYYQRPATKDDVKELRAQLGMQSISAWQEYVLDEDGSPSVYVLVEDGEYIEPFPSPEPTKDMNFIVLLRTRRGHHKVIHQYTGSIFSADHPLCVHLASESTDERILEKKTMLEADKKESERFKQALDSKLQQGKFTQKDQLTIEERVYQLTRRQLKHWLKDRELKERTETLFNYMHEHVDDYSELLRRCLYQLNISPVSLLNKLELYLRNNCGLGQIPVETSSASS